MLPQIQNVGIQWFDSTEQRRRRHRRLSFGLLIVLWAGQSAIWGGEVGLNAAAKEIETKAMTLNTKVVAVLPFTSEKSQEKIAPKISEDLISMLTKSGKVVVVEKLLVERLYKEMAFQQTGVFDEKNLPVIGERLGAEALVTGKVASCNGNHCTVEIQMVLAAKPKKGANKKSQILWSGSISYDSVQEVRQAKIINSRLEQGFWFFGGGLPVYQSYSTDDIPSMRGKLLSPTFDLRAGSGADKSGALAFTYGFYYFSFANEEDATGVRKTVTKFNQPDTVQVSALNEDAVTGSGFGFSFSLFYRIPLWKYAVIEGGSHAYLGAMVGIGPGSLKILGGSELPISLPVKLIAGYSHSVSVSTALNLEVQFGPNSGFLSSNISGQSVWVAIGFTQFVSGASPW